MTRALTILALLALASSAAAAQFKNKGGPHFLAGYSNGIDCEGRVTEACTAQKHGYVCTSRDGKGIKVETAKYLSWECAEKKGYYRAMVEVTTVDAKGQKSTETVCEYGIMDFLTGANRWSMGKRCPTEATEVDKYSEFFYSVDSADTC